MKQAWSERTLGLVAVAALALALGFDLATGDVQADRRGPSVDGPVYETRASFCPPPFSRSKATTSLAVAADPGAPATVGVEPGETGARELPADRTVGVPVTGPALEVVGYGGRVHAAALLSATKPVEGAGAARCPRVVSDRWYFPMGSSALGFDERLLIRNPFADEAAVSVRFFTPGGIITKANLGDGEVAVPAGESKFIKINDFILRQPVLGALVDAERGRVVAWRVLFAEPEQNPDGVQFSLGATAPALEWFFPEGAVESGVEEELSFLNPHKKEAVLSVSLPTASRPVPKLIQVRVPPESLRTISLPEVVGGANRTTGAVGAIVRSTNGVGVVAERTVWYAASRTGVSSEIGAPAAATDWMVLPAAASSPDDSVVLLNPGSRSARVSLTILSRDRGALRPGGLRDIKVRASSRLRVVLNDFTGGQAVAVVVASDQPIVAERVATAANGDVSSLMGGAFTPSER